MMRIEPLIKNIMDSLVPITRFNRGEANKIFDEVSENGVKIVLKNNAPTCVLIEPSRYEAMIEALEDYALYFEAVKRSEASQGNSLSSEQVYTLLDINETELDGIEASFE